MSLCRFSTDNFKCDLYCYYDVRGGITIHIKGDLDDSINVNSIEEFRANLKSLRNSGYKFPDYLFEVDEEPE